MFDKIEDLASKLVSVINGNLEFQIKDDLEKPAYVNPAGAYEINCNVAIKSDELILTINNSIKDNEIRISFPIKEFATYENFLEDLMKEVDTQIGPLDISTTRFPPLESNEEANYLFKVDFSS